MEIIKKKADSAQKIWIFLAVFVAIIIGRDIMVLPISFGMISLFTIMCGVFLNNKERALFVCACLPFCRGIPYSEILLIMLGLSFLSGLGNLKIKLIYYMPVIGIGMIELLDYVYFNHFSNEIIYLLIYMLYATYILEQKIYEGIEQKIAYIYSIATIASVLIVVTREIKLMGLDYVFTYNVRFGANTAGAMVTNYNANELGLYCAVAASLMLLLYYVNAKTYYMFLAAVTTVIGFMCVSRAYLLVIVLVWLFYFIYSKKNFKSLVSIISVAILAFFVIAQFFPEISDWLFGYYTERMDEENLDQMGGRFTIILKYLGFSFSSAWTLLFGYSGEYVQSLEAGAVHNGIQEVFVCWGILGLLIVFGWVVLLLKNSNEKMCKGNYTRFTPFIIFFIYIQSLQWFSMHNYLILMMISMVGISIIPSKEEKVVKKRNSPWIKNNVNVVGK